MQPIIVTFDGDEYRVPAPDGREAGAYYTDDLDDALGTLRMIWKCPNCEMEIREVDVHPPGVDGYPTDL